MEKINVFERLIWFLFNWRQWFCRHRKVQTSFTAEVFHNDGYERCSGNGQCLKCGFDVWVTVPANQMEKENQ